LNGHAQSGAKSEGQRTQYAGEAYPVRTVNRARFDPAFRPAIVSAPPGYPSGTLLVDTAKRQIFLIGSDGKARRYGVAVSASGHSWSGQAKVGRMTKWPAWYPTDDMRNEAPGLPDRIAPGPENPLGARALYLYRDGADTLYRIHGTPEPWTIGTEASSGCIRMINEDIIDLYHRVFRRHCCRGAVKRRVRRQPPYHSIPRSARCAREGSSGTAAAADTDLQGAVKVSLAAAWLLSGDG
jgi:lipoprotein-anchoring transpeptidase ErfK/SrfK